MPTPLAASVCRAFGLGDPLGFDPVQYTSFETWKLTTSTGAYLVKRLWKGPDPSWWVERARAMEYEQRVMSAGVLTAVPVAPLSPSFGWAARVSDSTFRVYEWVPHRTLTAAEPVIDWFGTTLATLHRLGEGAAYEAPQWFGLHPRESWTRWISLGEGTAWQPLLADRLEFLLEFSARLASAYEKAGDYVTSHGDFEPYNVLVADHGLVLIDWESVGVASAGFELGRALLSFGSLSGVRDPEAVQAMLDAYRAAGGQAADLGRDLFLGRLALDLLHIAQLVRTSVGENPQGGWMEKEFANNGLVRRLKEFPARVDELTREAEGYSRTR